MFIVLLYFCSVLSASAYLVEGVCGADVTYSISDDGTCLMIKGTGPMNDYYGASPWDYYAPFITKLRIDPRITKIGSRAFEGLGIMSVNIPNNVTSIGDFAFEGCRSLYQVHIGTKVTSIGSFTFLNCENLRMVLNYSSIPQASNGSMPSSAFVYVLPDYYDKYMESTVWNKFSIGTSMNLTGECSTDLESNPITYILNEYNGEMSILGAGDSMIDQAPEHLLFTDDVRSKIKKVKIDGGITRIGNYFFYDCPNLKEIEWSGIDKEKSVGEYAFANCNSVESFHIFTQTTPTIATNCLPPSGTIFLHGVDKVTCLQTPGWYWYAERLIANSKIEGTCGDNITYSFNPNTGELILIGIGNIPVNMMPWKSFEGLLKSVVVEEGITNIPSSAFNSVKSLEKVTLPHSVQTIGTNAFEGCTNLQTLILQNGLKEIGYRAFYDCSSLSSVTIPNTVTELGISAFAYCTGLTEVTIGRNVSTMPGNIFNYSDYYGTNGVFSKCTNITSVTNLSKIPQSKNGCLPTACTLHVLQGYKDVYNQTAVWNGYNIVDDIEDIVTAESIRLDKNSVQMILGEEMAFNVTILPEDTKNKNVSWKSSNPSVAFFIGRTLFAAGIGKTTISATTTDGTGLTATCEVTVENQTINLVDGATSFVNEEEVDCKKLTYTRTISIAQADKYQALYIPMTVDVTSLDERINVYKIMAMFFFDLDGDGVNDESYLRITPLNSGVLMPNHAYIFKAKEADTYTFNSCDNILYPAETNELTCSTTEIDFTFKGNYVRHNPGITFYGMSGGSIKNAEGNVGAFRWYATMTDKEGQIISSLNSKINIFDSDMTDTDTNKTIEQIQIEGIYSLNGNKLSTLQKGVNIIKFTDGTIIKQYKNN